METNKNREIFKQSSDILNLMPMQSGRQHVQERTTMSTYDHPINHKSVNSLIHNILLDYKTHNSSGEQCLTSIDLTESDRNEIVSQIIFFSEDCDKINFLGEGDGTPYLMKLFSDCLTKSGRYENDLFLTQMKRQSYLYYKDIIDEKITEIISDIHQDEMEFCGKKAWVDHNNGETSWI